MGRFRMPSPAMGVALAALFVALGGTTYAAVSLPANSVGTVQLKNSAVTGAKVKDASITGADIRLATLGTVPLAAHAKRADTAGTADAAAHATAADSATHATTADLATRAATADAAGTAYTTHFENAVPLAGTPKVVSTLNLPAGSYVLVAKEQIDTQNNGDIVECDLGAGTDIDRSFGQGGASHQSQILANNVVHAFPVAGAATLSCTGFGASAVVSQVRVTAIPVAAVVTAP